MVELAKWGQDPIPSNYLLQVAFLPYSIQATLLEFWFTLSSLTSHSEAVEIDILKNRPLPLNGQLKIWKVFLTNIPRQILSLTFSVCTYL